MHLARANWRGMVKLHGQCNAPGEVIGVGLTLELVYCTVPSSFYLMQSLLYLTESAALKLAPKFKSRSIFFLNQLQHAPTIHVLLRYHVLHELN